MAFGISAATAAVVGGGLAAAGAVGGALISANGAKNAANQQANAAKDANALQQYMYDQAREDQAPWRTAGTNALSQLLLRTGVSPVGSSAYNNALLKTQENFDPQAYLRANPDVAAAGADPWSHYTRFGANEGRQFTYNSAAQDILDQKAKADQAQQNGSFGDLTRNFTAQDFQADPGYEFRLGEGMKGIENSAAARGGLLSGAALKAAGQYNQNFASNEYQNAYNRFNTNQTNTYNRLASLAGVGQTANSAVQSAGQNYANQAGANLIGAGNAAAAGAQRASGYIGQGIGFAANQLTNNWGNYGSNNPDGSYSATSTPVNDYYAGTQPYATLS